MTEPHARTPDWNEIDTVLFDLDGTLLDLSFDNHLWSEVVPAAYAAARSVTKDHARAVLKAHLAARTGTLDWYCMEYWNRELALDVTELHRTHADRIGWLPGARETLVGLRQLGKRLVLMTNSHRHTLEVKEQQVGIKRYFDAVFSSHDFGIPKEDVRFWPLLQAVEPFDLERTLFVDDNASVLKSARAAGIRHVYAMCHPDSSRPPRQHPDFPSVHSVAELLAS